MLDAHLLADLLTERFGVTLLGESNDDSAGQRALFQPRDLPRTQGFAIEVVIGWRSIETRFIPASFARALLLTMESSSPAQRLIFATFVRSSLNDGAAVTFRINDRDCDPLDADSWPMKWSSVIFATQKGPMVIDGSDPAVLQSLALTWASRILGAVLSLLPLEPIEQKPIGEAEGGPRQVLVTRYERSSINRAACIEIHGRRCMVCGFDFERFYGQVGRGFIEVHHRETVASLAPGTILNPETDLVPVCANCHAMLHRRTPPYTVDELRAVVRDSELRRQGANAARTISQET